MITPDALLELARGLLEPSVTEFVAAAAERIQELLPSDDVVWIDCDWQTQKFVAWRGADATRDQKVELMLQASYGNPAVQALLHSPNLAPQRLSDLQTQGGAGSDFQRICANTIGPHQLSVLVDVDASSAARGWMLVRDGREFDDHDLDQAFRLTPVLYMLDRLRRPSLPAVAANASAAIELTVREAEIVDLLSTGLTAVAIGHLLGISPRTVSKHLQNAYQKLGTHDRLVVSQQRARAADQGG